MDIYLSQLMSLLGVIVGAGMTYWVGVASERRRWKREFSVRWDASRLLAYVEYGYALKNVLDTALRVANDLGYHNHGTPLSQEEGIPLIAALESERASKWEKVLLLGSSKSIEAGRNWHRVVWDIQEVVRGRTVSADEWSSLYRSMAVSRDTFYNCTRSELGIPGEVPLSRISAPVGRIDAQ
jgi:hypothetical protein